MPIGANVNYQPLQGVTEAQGVANDRITTQATPADFGAEKGAALSQLGGQIQDTALMYAKQAAEAHADDVIANQLVPATAKISSDYYQTKGMQAHAAYQPSIDALNQAQENAIKDLPQYQQNLVRSFSIRHITNLQDGMARHLDEQQTAYEKQGVNDFVDAQGSIAVGAGSNPDVINQAIQSAVGKSALYATSPTGAGIDPNDPQGKVILDENARQITGKITQQVVGAAVARGDIGFANNFYAQNKQSISGDQQLEIDKMLHADTMKDWATSSVAALKNNLPIPPTANGGMQAVQVKSTVASTAQQAGVDPNSSLMIAGIESSFGQNTGNRGDIGQTGKPAANLQEQAQNLVEEQKTAQAAADQAVGGKAAPWQMYTVYQQGVGGGVALLNPENANKPAVSVLSQFYKNPQDALAAIQKNGGNANMTSGQFTDFLKQKCEQTYNQVACDDPNNKDLGNAIMQPHTQPGVAAVQPATNPVEALRQYDQQYPNMLARVQQIQNPEQREHLLSALEQDHAIAGAQANAWKNQFSGKIQDIVTSPDFVSMSDPRITPELRAAMSDDPQVLTMARNMAKANLEESQGKDTGKLGTAYWDTFKQINSGQITDISQLNSLAGSGLTREGLTQAKKDLDDMKSPDGAAESEMRKQFFANAKAQISGADEGLHIKDPKGEELYLKFMAQAIPAIQKAKSEGVPVSDIYNPDSKDYVGKSITTFKRPMSQWVGDMMQESPVNDVDTSTAQGLISAVQAGKVSRSDGEKIALKNGWIQANAPQVPMAQ